MKKIASKKIRVGIIGSGQAAACHARALRYNRTFHLAGVASRNHQKALELATCFACKSFVQPRELIKDSQVDALILAVPPAVQLGFLKQALEKKIPVLCEKPLGLSVLSAAKAIKGPSKQAQKAGINFCYRLVPEIKWFRKCLQNQACGFPWQVQVEWVLGNRLQKNQKKISQWKQKSRLGGGVLYNYGIHVLDYLFHGLQKPILLASAWQKMKGRQATEAGVMSWSLPQGLVSIHLSLLSAQKPIHRITLRGPLGGIKVENKSSSNPAGPFRITVEGSIRLPPLPKSNMPSLEKLFAKIQLAWISKIHGRGFQELPSLEDGFQALRLAEQANRKYRRLL